MAFALIALVSYPAYAAHFGSVQVHVRKANAIGDRAYGYYELRFQLRNDGKADHTVGLRVPAHNGVQSGNYLAGVSATYNLPAGARRQVSLFIPCLPISGGLSVTIDGVLQRHEMIVPQTNVTAGGPIWYSPSAAEWSILLSPASANLQTDFETWATASVHRVYGELHEHAKFERARQGVSQWSHHWLAYSSYAALILTADDLHAMPQQVRDAIWKYVRCGGYLLLLNGKRQDIPTVWRHWLETGTGADQPALPHAAPAVHFGFSPKPVHGSRYAGVFIAAAPPAARPDLSKLPTGVRSFAVGFGVCWETPSAAIGTWTKTDYQRFKAVFTQPDAPMQMHTPEDANTILPVVRNLRIPTRGLLAILAIFAFIVGPVNLIVLGLKRRKMWLWATVPAIALLFSAGVFAYTVVSEGFYGVRRATMCTVLNQTNHQATTIGWIGYYTPLTPGGGLHFSRTTELTPEISTGRTWDASRSPRFMDWSQDQYLTAGWVAARVPALFAVRKAAGTQARVEIGHGSDGTVTAVNGLGVKIMSLWYADAQGRVFRSGPIIAGASEVLRPDARLSAKAPLANLRELFASASWPASIATAATSGRNYLRPGTYLAVLNSSPFIEPGLSGTRQRPAPSIVYGVGLGGNHAN